MSSPARDYQKGTFAGLSTPCRPGTATISINSCQSYKKHIIQELDWVSGSIEKGQQRMFKCESLLGLMLKNSKCSENSSKDQLFCWKTTSQLLSFKFSMTLADIETWARTRFRHRDLSWSKSSNFVRKTFCCYYFHLSCILQSWNLKIWPF